MCGCKGFFMLCHTEMVSETPERGHEPMGLYICMCQYASMFMCECGACVSLVYTQTHSFIAHTCTEAKRRQHQTFTLCPTSLETEARLVATNPKYLLIHVPFSTGLTDTHVTPPSVGEVVTSRW